MLRWSKPPGMTGLLEAVSTVTEGHYLILRVNKRYHVCVSYPGSLQPLWIKRCNTLDAAMQAAERVEGNVILNAI